MTYLSTYDNNITWTLVLTCLCPRKSLLHVDISSRETTYIDSFKYLLTFLMTGTYIAKQQNGDLFYWRVNGYSLPTKVIHISGMLTSEL